MPSRGPGGPLLLSLSSVAMPLRNTAVWRYQRGPLPFWQRMTWGPCPSLSGRLRRTQDEEERELPGGGEGLPPGLPEDGGDGGGGAWPGRAGSRPPHRPGPGGG